VLGQALDATFRRQKTEIPQGDPLPLTEEFAENKVGQWRAFLRKNGLEAEGATLGRVTEALLSSILPAFGCFSIGS